MPRYLDVVGDARLSFRARIEGLPPGIHSPDLDFPTEYLKSQRRSNLSRPCDSPSNGQRLSCGVGALTASQPSIDDLPLEPRFLHTPPAPSAC